MNSEICAENVKMSNFAATVHEQYPQQWVNSKKIGLKRVEKKKAEMQTRVSVVSAQSKRALSAFVGKRTSHVCVFTFFLSFFVFFFFVVIFYLFIFFSV